MAHYTPKFKKLLEAVEQAFIEHDEQTAKLLFREGCLKLGHRERICNLYRVRDKLTRKATFFKPNWSQNDYLRKVLPANRKDARILRSIILKTRQVGFTTLSCVRALDYALWEANMATGIMVHQQDTARTIFEDIVKYSYEHFKKDWGKFYSPAQKSDSSTTLAFSDDGLGRPLNSSMRVLFNFRGKTPNFLHVSEASRIKDARLLGSLQGVPANGEVIYESTPNGRGGEFHRVWMDWMKLGRQAPYHGFFYPWWSVYPEDLNDKRWLLDPDTELTNYEKDQLIPFLLEQDFTDAQARQKVAWRRWCISANCLGDADRFENEYPTNDEDCWFTGEGQVFSRELLKALSKNVKEPKKTGFLIPEGQRKFTFSEDKNGVTAIWEEPDPMKSYVIGCDPSGGVGKDRGACYVKCLQSGNYVARVWGQLVPEDFANEVLKLAYYYNKAWICPENNNHGHVVLHVLKTKGYANIYRKRTIDQFTDKPTLKLGFTTTNESKLVITEGLKNSLRSGKARPFDDALLSELSTFVQISSETGASVRRAAANGCHDDLVMAAALTEEMAAQRKIVNHDQEPLQALPEGVTSQDFF